MLIERLRIAAAQARCILERGAYGRWSLARLLRRLPPDRLIAMERITIPHWLLTLKCMTPGRYARKQEAYAAVNAMTGECAWLAEAPRLAAPEGTGGLRPALVTEGEALSLLRRQIVPGRALASGAASAEAALIGVPFWVGYFQAAGRSALRIRLIHGSTGKVEPYTAAVGWLREEAALK